MALTKTLKGKVYDRKITVRCYTCGKVYTKWADTMLNFCLDGTECKCKPNFCIIAESKPLKTQVEILKRHYSLDEVCDILGFFDESNPGFEKIGGFAKLNKMYHHDSQKFADIMFEMAIGNGNFEEVIKYDARLPI